MSSIDHETSPFRPGLFAGRVALVTGGGTGIGRAIAEELSALGARVALCGRRVEPVTELAEALRAKGAEAHGASVDIRSPESIDAFVKDVLARFGTIDLLVNNAGLAGPRGLTKDGFELTVGTNHLGPFLFTVLLLPRLRESKPARVVNVASKMHAKAPGLGFEHWRTSTRSITGTPEYAVSKLCNVLFTRSLAAGKAGDGVHSYAVHPGVIASDVWREVSWSVRPIMKRFMKSPEEGAATSLYCATSPDVAEHDGRYYDACREAKPSPLALDAALAETLWAKSAELVGLGV